jgi:hypothetical protein
MDPSRKTLRHFYCRDVLWQSFQTLSDTLDLGVDELVNEAMRAFAQQRGVLPSDFATSPSSGPSDEPVTNSEVATTVPDGRFTICFDIATVSSARAAEAIALLELGLSQTLKVAEARPLPPIDGELNSCAARGVT